MAQSVSESLSKYDQAADATEKKAAFKELTDSYNNIRSLKEKADQLKMQKEGIEKKCTQLTDLGALTVADAKQDKVNRAIFTGQKTKFAANIKNMNSRLEVYESLLAPQMDRANALVPRPKAQII